MCCNMGTHMMPPPHNEICGGRFGGETTLGRTPGEECFREKNNLGKGKLLLVRNFNLRKTQS